MTESLPSLGPRLGSARAKVRRANHQIGALKQSIQRFTALNPYSIGAEQYHSPIVLQTARIVLPVNLSPSGLVLPPGQPEMRTRTFMAWVTATPRPAIIPPLLRWGTIIGEIVHDIASALDNLVWELVQINPNPPGLPQNSSHKQRAEWARLERSIGFPYCEDPKKWGDISNRNLFFVDPAIHAVFQQVQPAFARQHPGKSPHDHPFWILHELWNGDKHRTANVVVAAVGFQSAFISLRDIAPQLQQFPTETIQTFPLRPIEGKTMIGVVRVHLPFEITIPVQINMDLNANLSLGILFGQGAPAEGENILDVLKDAASEAEAFITRFA